jgi:hypothetical protein
MRLSCCDAVSVAGAVDCVGSMYRSGSASVRFIEQIQQCFYNVIKRNIYGYDAR